VGGAHGETLEQTGRSSPGKDDQRREGLSEIWNRE
jgi:hypothetical protein